ncbi:ATP-dependent RNA helicase DDX3X [Sarotherodon galilaeus]
MGSGKHLLLIAVLPLLVRCQKPQALMVPAFKMAFIGDTVYLKCNTSASSVTWHKPNGEPIVGEDPLKVEIKNLNDGGSYWCETSGEKSDPLSVNVMESGLSASLTIETGYQKMWKGGAVILKLENEDGLQGWRCWVYRGGEKPIMVSLKLKGVDNSMVFQTADLNVDETIYWCTDKLRTQRSNQVILTTSDAWEAPVPPEEGGKVGIVLGILLVLLGMLVVIVVVGLRRRRRSEEGRIYEDVAMRSKERGDDKYETLEKASGREREYDTLAGASGGEPKGGEYEPLKQGEMKEGVYHTLGAEGAAGGEGGEGGYEALKKSEMKEGVYHALGAEGAAGGEGGYEALKKGEMKEGVYHALGAEGAAGGEGGYEALKKGETKEGVYHTLAVEGAAGGEGGYEAVGRKDKPSESATAGE